MEWCVGGETLQGFKGGGWAGRKRETGRDEVGMGECKSVADGKGGDWSTVRGRMRQLKGLHGGGGGSHNQGRNGIPDSSMITIYGNNV